MRSDAVETVERGLSLAFAPHDADEHARMPEIRRDFHAGYRDEADYPWVLGRLGEKGRNLDADGFGYPVGTPRVTQKPSA